MNPSTIRITAPIEIAESATLNAGQCQPNAWKSRKSTTWPKRRRSMSLPIAPPRISARPRQRICRPGLRTMKTLTAIAAIIAKALSSGACQPGACANRLNAAPLLNTSTRLKKSVTARCSPGAKCRSTIHLTIWSVTTSAAASANQRRALSKSARFTRSLQIELAAPAQRVGVDVGAVVPAAVAFRMRAGRHVRNDRKLSLPQRRTRGNEHEAEIVAQPPQRLVGRARRPDVDLGLERRSQLLGDAFFLDPFRHDVAELPHLAPGTENVLGQ